MLKDPGKDGKIKNALSFKGTGLKIQPLFMFMKRKKCLNATLHL
jgi:hypothetical protein